MSPAKLQRNGDASFPRHSSQGLAGTQTQGQKYHMPVSIPRDGRIQCPHPGAGRPSIVPDAAHCALRDSSPRVIK